MLDRRERRALALHESAHAVVAMSLDVKVHSIGLGPACVHKEAAGQCVHDPPEDVFKSLVIKLAGRAAEKRFDPQADHGAAGDYEDVRRCLNERYGRQVGSLDLPIVAKARARAEAIIEQRWHEIEALAGELTLKIEIEGHAVREIVGRAALERITETIEKLERFA